MQSFGETGRQQANDCTFDAGKIFSVPIKISYFLVLMFAFQLYSAFQQRAEPWYLPVAYAGGTQILLFLTVLIHEFGHGTMAKHLGGQIMQILLWPFGGICFSTRPTGVFDRTEKLKNELKIVWAGPLTHFVQAPFWICSLLLMMYVMKIEVTASLLWLLVPLASHPVPLGLTNPMSWLAWKLFEFGVVVNVFLFLFNVFFPMYPMDGAKIIACSLQLCGTSARTAAKVLIGTSVPLSCLLIYYAFAHRRSELMPMLSAYMAIMCLLEAWKIYQLMEKRQLHTHHLFEAARNEIAYDSRMGAYRLNTQTVDDTERAETRIAAGSNYVLFEGQGNRILAETDDRRDQEQYQLPDTRASPPADSSKRKEFLDKLEERERDGKKNVREMTEERLDTLEQQRSKNQNQI